MTPPRAVLIQTLAEASKVNLASADVWDYETTGLYWWKDEVYALAALVNDQPYVFVGEALSYAREQLAANIADSSSTVIAYNAKFELHFTSHDVLPVRARIIDPSLALFLIDENRFSGSGHGLKDAVKQLFNYTMVDFKKMLGRVTEETGEYKTRKCTKCAGKGWRGRDHSQCDGCAGVGTEARPLTRNRLRLISEVPIEEMAQYAGEDVWWTKKVWEWCEPRLKANPFLERNFNDVQMPLLRTLYDGEHRGIRVDVEAAAELREKYLSKIGEIDAEVLSRTGYVVEGSTAISDDSEEADDTDVCGGEDTVRQDRVVNLNSPGQVDAFLYGYLRLKRPPFRNKRKAKDGSRVASQWQTDENCLLWLAKHSGNPIAKLVWQRRKYAKYVGTYLDNILGWAEPQECNGEQIWVLYPNFNQTAARTGRLSSSKPLNFQNIPHMEAFRRLFIARPGCLFIIGDAKQVELRFLAHYSGEPALVEAYSDPNRDLHQETADTFGITRYVGKTANFAEVYEVYGNTFSMQLFADTEGEVDLTKDEAQDILDRIRQGRPAVKRWKLNTVQGLKSYGYITTIENRRRRLKEINDPNWGKSKYAERQGINAKIQGSVGDLFARELGDEKYIGRFRLQIHDEILSEVPIIESEQFAVSVRTSIESFTQRYKMRVPILADVSIGSDWSAK